MHAGLFVGIPSKSLCTLEYTDHAQNLTFTNLVMKTFIIGQNVSKSFKLNVHSTEVQREPTQQKIALPCDKVSHFQAV